MKKKRTKEPLFGAPLLSTGTEIPFLLNKFMEFYSMRGCSAEGLFRVTGNIDAVERLKKKLNKGKNIDISLENPHVIASLLKLYFRELPEPLFTFAAYDELLAVGELTEEQEIQEKATEILQKLPMMNRIIIRYLFEFLSRVCQNAETNKMHANNLAIVFAPTLLKSSDSSSLISSSAGATRVVEMMINHYSNIFKDEPLPSESGIMIKKTWNRGKDSELAARMKEEWMRMSSESEDSSHRANSFSVHPELLSSSQQMEYSAEISKQIGQVRPPRPPRPVSDNLSKPPPPPRRNSVKPKHNESPLRPNFSHLKSRPQSMKIPPGNYTGDSNNAIPFVKPHRPPRKPAHMRASDGMLNESLRNRGPVPSTSVPSPLSKSGNVQARVKPAPPPRRKQESAPNLNS